MVKPCQPDAGDNQGNFINDQEIEKEIQDKGKTAARITPEMVEANIASQWFFTAGDGCHGVQTTLNPGEPTCYDSSLDSLTFCVLILKNGFRVIGESVCVSPENFDAEIGRKIARQNAVSKIWPLMGYALKSEIHGTQWNK